MNMALFLDSLRKAAALNTAGVNALYQPGKNACDLALRYFRKSLHVLKALSVSEHASPQHNGAFCKSRILTANEVTMSMAGHSSPFQVYNHPKIFFPPQDSEAIDATLLRYTAAVIFNTGLAYHQRSIIEASSRTKCHWAAHKLYNACSSLCSTFLTDKGLEHCEDLLLLYVATTNNLAHVQRELAQEASFKASLELLKEVMTHVVNSRQDLSEEEWDGINEVHLNTVLDQPIVAAAA
jgi:hypothetical protein